MSSIRQSLSVLPLFLIAASSRPANHVSATDPLFIPLHMPYNGYAKVYSNISLGTPSQNPIQSVIDLGSAGFWVYGPNAVVNYGSPYFGAEGPCNTTATPFYSPNSSSTSVDYHYAPSGFSYGGNGKSIYTYYAVNDTVRFGGGKGSSVIGDLEFAISNFTRVKIGYNGCTGVDYDKSILGLAPSSWRALGPSVRENLLSQGRIESSTLSMWFDKAPKGAEDDFHGTALFGAIPKDKYVGDLVQVAPLADDSTVGYYVPLPKWSANSVSNRKASRTIKPYDDTSRCLVDSGSGQDYLPIDMDDFLNATGLIQYNGYPAYNGSCDSMPRDLAMSMTFPGLKNGTDVTVKIPLRNWARGITDYLGDKTKCGLSMELSSPQSCTLGSPFFTGAFLAINDELNQIAIAQGGVSKGALDGVHGLGEMEVIRKGQGLP